MNRNRLTALLLGAVLLTGCAGNVVQTEAAPVSSAISAAGNAATET